MTRRVQLFIGTKNGLFRCDSDEKRQTWRLSGPFLPGWTISALDVDPGPRGRIRAATAHLAYGPSIRISDDAGESWTEVLDSPRFDGRGQETVNQIWRIVSSKALFYCGVDDAALFSSDDGLFWTEVTSLSRFLDRGERPVRAGRPIDSVVVDAMDPGRLWVGHRRSGVYRTRDQGETWERCDDGLPPIVSLMGDPTIPGLLFAQTANGMFRSVNGGDSWQRADRGLPSRFGFALHAPGHRVAYTVPLESQTERHPHGGRLTVYRTTDGGENWAPLAPIVERHYYAGVLRDGLETDALDPLGLYVGTTAGEVFFSTDGGASWSKFPEGFARITVVKARVVGAEDKSAGRREAVKGARR